MKLCGNLKVNNKGAALPAVIIISALLTIMVVSLANISVQQLQASKHDRNIDYTYIAGQSMVEKTVSYIKGYLESKSYMNSVNYTTDGQYAVDVVGEIWSNINRDINGNNAVRTIDVADTPEKALARVVSVEFLQLLSVNANMLEVRMGIKTSAAFSRGIYSASNKPVYAVKTFEIEKPVQFHMKPAAFNGIGDVFASGYLQAIIKGDVKAVGAAPDKAKGTEQYYYGGIYARENANLKIEGSAFTRGFIRTGGYADDFDDNSMIDITKDAAAQCIQAFGKGDGILVHKDAFTFDDLEMNGLNSVIAINRNYFGLSHGDDSGAGNYHDASSAVVNSSVVHHPDELSDAMRSKIVINGNVFINGGTFWVDPQTGDILHPDILGEGGLPSKKGTPQIEDASTAWSYDDEMPTYKNYDFELDPPYNNSDAIDKYHAPDRQNDWIYKQYSVGKANGYGNYFQIWAPQNDSVIYNWFNTLKGSYMNIYPQLPPGAGSISEIKGLCMYDMAANGKMYFMVRDSNEPISPATTQEDSSGIKRAMDVLDSEAEYSDALYYLYPGSTAYDSAFKWPSWAAALNDSWDKYVKDSIENLKDIRDPLLKITEDFVSRNYDYVNSGNIINNFNKVQVTSSNFKTAFDYIGDELSSIGASAYVITGSEIDSIDSTFPKGPDGNYLISQYLNSMDPSVSDPNGFYIIVNDDPDKTLEINSHMNGIVYSRGKVVMSAGADLKGFIIAAGRGCDGSGGVDGSTADAVYDSSTGNYVPTRMPVISGSNLDRLDDGSYAALEFKGSASASGSTAVIDFTDESGNSDPDTALAYLLNKFNEEDGSIFVVLNRLFNS